MARLHSATKKWTITVHPCSDEPGHIHQDGYYSHERLVTAANACRDAHILGGSIRLEVEMLLQAST